jgi:L-fucose mutarotase
MLRQVNPLLTPELLFVLAAMGHGDEIAVVDANFPAYAVARSTSHGRPICLPGVALGQVVAAVLSLLPLDELVEAPVRKMATGSGTDELEEVQRELQRLVDDDGGRHWPMHTLERFAFYEAARGAYALVLTGERRLFANVLIRKGALPPSQ